ncbi:hypothetical protein ACNI3K_01845 [Demequina sp. SO4-13]|uniref:hypothetical protein n=1 Tax=Demequina sp. SO4-13 TaxID=3401027 RepID=UPI003AF676F2
MTEHELRRQAFKTWLTARPPRWASIAMAPFGIALTILTVWFFATLSNPPRWILPVSEPLSVILWLLLIAGFAGSYRRILRDLKREQGDSATS